MRNLINANVMSDIMVNRIDCTIVARTVAGGMVELRDCGLQHPRIYASGESAASAARSGFKRSCAPGLRCLPSMQKHAGTEPGSQTRWLTMARHSLPATATIA